MKIAVADRLHFFSHKPGHKVVIPGCLWYVQAFPTALIIYNEEDVVCEFALALQGPVSPFTVEQDLDSLCVRIYGEAKQGYFRMVLSLNADQDLTLRFEKTPKEGLIVNGKAVVSQDIWTLAEKIIPSKDVCSSYEKLFLGISKKKECDLIRKRKDLREILPFWHALGKISPFHSEIDSGKLTSIQQAIAQKQKNTIEDLFLHTYLSLFSEGLVPRKEDEEKQGFYFEEFTSPYNLLRTGYFLIRSLFFAEEKEGFHILPCLLPRFVVGKLLHIKTSTGCLIDMEWSKSRLRKMRIKVEKKQDLRLIFPKEIDGFRVKSSCQKEDSFGKEHRGNFFEQSVTPAEVLMFDRFQR